MVDCSKTFDGFVTVSGGNFMVNNNAAFSRRRRHPNGTVGKDPEDHQQAVLVLTGAGETGQGRQV